MEDAFERKNYINIDYYQLALASSLEKRQNFKKIKNKIVCVCAFFVRVNVREQSLALVLFLCTKLLSHSIKELILGRNNTSTFNRSTPPK